MLAPQDDQPWSMFTFGASKSSTAALAATSRVKEWLGALIASSERDSCTLMVSEVECTIPGCAPLEVVLVVLHDPDSDDDDDAGRPPRRRGGAKAAIVSAPSGRWVSKVMVPLADVTQQLVAAAASAADNALPWATAAAAAATAAAAAATAVPAIPTGPDEAALVARLEVALEALAALQGARTERDAVVSPTLADVPGAALVARLDTLQRRITQQRTLLQGRRRLARSGGGGGASAAKALAPRARVRARAAAPKAAATTTAATHSAKLNCPCWCVVSQRVLLSFLAPCQPPHSHTLSLSTATLTQFRYWSIGCYLKCK